MAPGGSFLASLIDEDTAATSATCSSSLRSSSSRYLATVPASGIPNNAIASTAASVARPTIRLRISAILPGGRQPGLCAGPTLAVRLPCASDLGARYRRRGGPRSRRPVCNSATVRSGPNNSGAPATVSATVASTAGQASEVGAITPRTSRYPPSWAVVSSPSVRLAQQARNDQRCAPARILG